MLAYLKVFFAVAMHGWYYCGKLVKDRITWNADGMESSNTALSMPAVGDGGAVQLDVPENIGRHRFQGGPIPSRTIAARCKRRPDTVTYW